MANDIYEQYGFEMLSGDVNYTTYGGVFMFKDPVMIAGGRKQKMDQAAYVVAALKDGEDVEGWKEKRNTYVSLSLVCPDAVKKDELNDVLAFVGLDREELKAMDKDTRTRVLVDACHGYGTMAPLSLTLVKGSEVEEVYRTEYLEEEEVERDFWQRLKRQAEFVGTAGIMQLDATLNAFGANGWDWLAGDKGI